MIGHLRSKGSRRAADGALGTQLKDMAELQDTLRFHRGERKTGTGELDVLQNTQRNKKGRHCIQRVIQMACWATDLTH